MKPRRILSGVSFRIRRLPGVFKRFKLWFLVGVFILAMVAAGPVLGPLAELLADAARAVGRILLPVLDNKIGRFVVANVVILIIVVFVYRRFKERGRRLLGSWALDRFLAGLLHLAGGRYAKAARALEKVVRVGRMIDLSTAVPVYPEILADARIKLALSYRELCQVEKAMRSLELLKVKDLSPGMRCDLAEAKAFVYSLSDDLMKETIDKEIGNALGKDSANRRLLRLKRDRAEESGDVDAAIVAQKRLARNVRRKERAAEKTRLAVLHARKSLQLRRAGKTDEAIEEISRCRSLDPRLVLASLLAGDIMAEMGKPRDAVEEWARVPGVAALDRIRGLLEEGRFEGGADLSFVAQAFPHAGILLVVGEHYLRGGDHRRARNCVRKYEELGLWDRHAAHLLSRIARGEGDREAAERLEWEALKGFLGG